MAIYERQFKTSGHFPWNPQKEKLVQMKYKSIFVGILLFLVIALVTCAYVWPAGCPSWKRQEMNSAKILKEYCRLISKYSCEHDGQFPISVSQVLQNIDVVGTRRRMLCRPGIDQSWKPIGWITNDNLTAVFADYVIIPTDREGLIISERPDIKGLKRIQYMEMGKSEPHKMEVRRKIPSDGFQWRTREH